MEDPHLKAVGLLREVEHPSEGRLIDIAPANKVSAGQRRDWQPAPRLGEHTEAVLAEAGYSAQQISTLLAEGAARVARPVAPAAAQESGSPAR